LADKSVLILKGLKSILKDTGMVNVNRELSTWDSVIRCVNLNNPEFLIFNYDLIKNKDKKNLKLFFNKGINLKFIVVYNEELPDYIKSQCIASVSIYEEENKIITILKDALKLEHNSTKDFHELSNREKAVVRCISLGMTNKEIADNLFISSHTVIAHRKNITKKLGIKTVSGLTVYAILNKLVNLEEIEQF